MRGFRFVALAWTLVAALAAPAAIWADDSQPAGTVPDTAVTTDPAAPPAPTTTATDPAPSPAQPSAPPATTAPAAAPAQGTAVATKERTPDAAVPIASAAGTTTVTIKDFEFTPPTINITVGDTVVWKNDGPTQHSSTSDQGAWDTGLLAKGKSGSHTFEEGGTYTYICTPHPFMKGKVVVAAASSGTTDTTGTEGSTGDTTAAPTFTDGSGSAVDSTSTGSSDSGSLASTGSDSALLALAGLLLLAGGVGLRRRLARPGD